MQRRSNGEEFRSIPVKVGANGAKVLLQDVAVIKDGFTEGERYFKFNGKNAIYLSVKATKEQNMIPVAESVKAYIDSKNESLPSGVRLVPLMDMTYYLNARLDMMLKNLFQGAILVAIMLSLFLRFKLALWVMVAYRLFLGALMTMPLFGISINIVIRLYHGLIVVDDAIVIGESAYTEIERKGGGVENVVRGAKRVATPATFGVLTTMAVFAPFTLSSGPERAFFFGIAVVVMACLAFSLIESKLILPAHIAHTKFPPIKKDGFRTRFNTRFFAFVNGPYRRTVEKCIEWRWVVLLSFIGMLVLSFTLIASNHVRMVPTPKVPHDFPQINIEMNDNASDMQTIRAVQKIEAMVREVDRETEQKGDLLVFNQGRTEATVLAPLLKKKFAYNAFELSRRWREAMPEIAGIKSLTIQDDVNGNPGGDGEFGYLLYGSDIDTLNAAGRQFISMLQQQKGLFDISSTIDPASKEVQLSLKPVAYDLGLDLQDIANQVGASFWR